MSKVQNPNGWIDDYNKVLILFESWRHNSYQFQISHMEPAHMTGLSRGSLFLVQFLQYIWIPKQLYRVFSQYPFCVCSIPLRSCRSFSPNHVKRRVTCKEKMPHTIHYRSSETNKKTNRMYKIFRSLKTVPKFDSSY